jgi:ligand-binding sensor domain-containing protein/serine phosphatase RsbU (regulator of sigma subunit)
MTRAIARCLCLILLTCQDFVAQQLRFRHLTSEDGLSTNFVKAVMQDDKGFMWFGTQDGLNRYDGYQFRVFKSEPGDTSSIISSDISALCQVSPELIIAGTRAGIALLNPMTEKFSRLSPDQMGALGRVNAILPLGKDSVMIGTETGLFVFRVRNRSLRALGFEGGSAPSVQCLLAHGHSLYIGTRDSGIYRVGPGGATEKVVLLLPSHISVGQEELASVTQLRSHSGRLYVATGNAGILEVSPTGEIERHISFVKQHPNADVIHDFIVRNNRIYAATGYGVLVYHLLTAQVSHSARQEAAQGLNSNACNAIYADRQENLWVATDLGGVNIAFYRSQKFPVSLYGYEGYFDNINSFYEARQGTVMLGGVKTLHELELGTANSVDHSPMVGDGTVLSIARESEHIYWIGTWGNGLIRYDIRTRVATNVLGKAHGATVPVLYVEGPELYAGTTGDGLFRIDFRTLKITHFGADEGLPNQSINCIFHDSRRRLWLGTYDGGLILIEGPLPPAGRLPVRNVYRNTGLANQIASNVVYAVNEDARGNIWIATSAGLSRLSDNGTFRNFYGRDGLHSTLLYSLLRDSAGHFWMSSNGGVLRFDPSLPDKEIIFKSYGIKDGLVNAEFNMGAAHFSSSGTMYFGGPRGFNAFRPSQVKDNEHVPPVYVTGYKRGGLDVTTDTLLAYKRHLVLEWKKNFFQFEVAALDFTDPQKNKFRYMLAGYDAGWSSPTNVRYVSYTELPGGTYTFSVKAANSDGIWNEAPASLVITVVPPFWKTTSFYILVIVMSLAAVYGFVHYRTRAVKLENRLLEMKVAERTRELEARNRDITSSIEYASRIQEAILPSKDHIFQKLKKVFILYRPKDIVSGDFYWFGERRGMKIFAVVDCTGHGVPGAFMSMIGHNLLHQIVNEKRIGDPGAILDELHRGVQKALRQGHNEISTNDGMDVSILAVNDRSRELRWAGANRPLVLIDIDGNFTRYEGDKFPVGGAQANLDRSFSTHVIKPHVATMAYMYSDGYADQFGGDKGKKFMLKRFHHLLTNIHKLPVEEQQGELERNFESWRQNHEQVDDVLIVGIEI